MVNWPNMTHSDLNVVINNAGVQYRRNFKENAVLENIDQEIMIKFTAPIYLIAELLPSLKRQPQAAIINVKSGLAFAPMADVPVDCATKAAYSLLYPEFASSVKKTTSVQVVEMVPPIVDTWSGW